MLGRNPWLGVEIRHLAALSAIERTGSFRGAADDLGYVQSAVSQQIARLEQVIGSRLVERSRGNSSVALTRAGEVVLVHADSLFKLLRVAQADLRRLSDPAGNVLRLGAYESAATNLLPRVLERLGDRIPLPHVEAEELGSSDAEARRLEDGELDACFVHLPVPAGPFDHQILMEERFVLLVAADSVLARRSEPPTLDEIATLPLIASPAWRVMPRIEAALGAAGVSPNVVARSPFNGAIHALVAAGVGVCVMPTLAVDPAHTATTALEIGDPPAPAQVALYWHRDRLCAGLDQLRVAAAVVCAELADDGALSLVG